MGCGKKAARNAFIAAGSGLKRRSFRKQSRQGPDQPYMRAYLDFEKPVAELEAKIEDLRKLAANGDPQAIGEDISRLETKADQSLKDIYAALTPWQKTQVARHPERPHLNHYITGLIEDFTPLAGDRYFGEDEAIVGGLGRFRGMSVCIMGQEKGSDTESRLRHNFGMAKPEGYRKAVRLMALADRFDIPVVSLVDTAGAYPGIGAEERGQAEAIAQSTSRGLEIGVPSVAVIIGEGGSGGAVAIATANRVLMLEHAIYTVASPEASASILWRDSARAQDAATNMKITAQDLLKFGVIDGIIKEPVGGAHRDQATIIAATGDAIEKAINSFAGKSRDDIRKARADKFLAIGRSL
jgi:acetyl-CoA carboxylase carboxyl transferase subunit alpha